MDNKEYRKQIDKNECTSRGVCTTSPTIAALEEVAVTFLQKIAYYILKLDRLGANNLNIRYKTISTLAGLISVNEFSEKQLFSVVIDEYYIYEEVKNTYVSRCKTLGLKANNIKLPFSFSEKTSLSKVINIGEVLLNKKSCNNNLVERNLYNILIILLKSLSQNLMKLKDFDAFDETTYKALLKVLDSLNKKTLSKDELRGKIELLAVLDNKTQQQISSNLLEVFEGINKVEVSHSTTQGKAILVSGNNFFDLYNLLERTKDINIDIYTHSNLLITHALGKFQQFKQLKGHYGNTTENCILDFATFPGAILLTKDSQNTTEYLYRGRLFSNDYIIPNGVIKIENNNFDELIETALNSKGFKHGKIKPSTELGYNPNEIQEKFEKLSEKLNSGYIKRLYIIGLNSYTETQKEYLNEFVNNLATDEYVISFSQCKTQENILHINIGNYPPLANHILEKLFQKYPINSKNITFLLTTCDIMTISGIIMLKVNKADNIYMLKCQPTQMNPSVFETFSKEFNIKNTTKAQQDLEAIRNK